MLYRITKRAVDFVGAFFGLMIFSPVILVISVLIKRSSPGPAIFCQTRVTQDGRVFGMYKFRSMSVWGESDMEYFKKHPAFFKKYQANGWKISIDDDPRVTGIGRFIRKTSFDELPQFWNVLVGEMSLVGPRAFRPEELEKKMKEFPKAKKDVAIMLTAKPGITGPWQVGSRNSVDFPERVRMDAEYAKTHSIFYDFEIMIKTPFKAFHREG